MTEFQRRSRSQNKKVTNDKSKPRAALQHYRTWDDCLSPLTSLLLEGPQQWPCGSRAGGDQLNMMESGSCWLSCAICLRTSFFVIMPRSRLFEERNQQSAKKTSINPDIEYDDGLYFRSKAGWRTKNKVSRENKLTSFLMRTRLEYYRTTAEKNYSPVLVRTMEEFIRPRAWFSKSRKNWKEIAFLWKKIRSTVSTVAV